MRLPGRYRRTMFWIATAAAFVASEPATDTPTAPKRQAQAVVRIVKAARVRLGEGSAGGDQQGSLRKASIRDGEGRPQPAVLVEFY